MADLNFGCATFCALPSFGAVTTSSSHTTFSSHKVSVKGSDIDMCSAIYFLFDHNTKYCTIYLCPHTVVATVVITSLVNTSPVPVKVKVGHTQKRSTMAKESCEGEFLKKKVLITTGKGLKIYPRQTLSRKHGHLDLDQLEFLPIFPYSELLIWMLHQLTDHSYFDSVYLKIFTALSFFGKLKTSVLYQCIVDLRIFFLFVCFFYVKKSSDLQQMDLPRTGSHMGSADT